MGPGEFDRFLRQEERREERNWVEEEWEYSDDDLRSMKADDDYAEYKES